MVTLLIKKAIDIALFIGFLAVTSTIVGVGSKIFNLDMPTVPAFNFKVEAGAEYNGGQGEVRSSLVFDFGGSQTASLTNKAAFITTTFKQPTATLSTNTAATKLGVNTAPGRVSFTLKGHQLPSR